MRQAIPEQYAADYGYPAPDQVEVTGKGSLRHLHPQRQLWKPYNNSDSQTIIATSQQAAVADALVSTGTLWGFNIGSASTGGHGVPLQQLDAIHHIKTGYYQPYTIASCANDTVEGSADERPLAFPIPPGVLPQMLPEHQINNSLLSLPAFPIQDLSRAEILKTPGLTWETRLRWIELPRDPFNASAIGAVILLPKTSPSPDGASTQKILVCTLGAGWGPSTLNTSTQLLGSSGVKSRISDPEVVAKKVFSYKSTEQDPGLPKAEDVAKLSDGFFVFPAYPERLINVSTNWAQYLNPMIVDEGVTVFHRLMQANISDDHPRVSAAIILPSLLANGLARIGFESSLQGDLRMTTNAQGESNADIDSWFRGKGDAFVVDPAQSKEWVKLEVFSTLEGYAYNTSGAGPKVAIIFLLAYCTFAFAHTCYAGISGISSSSWDSIGEVTALAMNSTPNLLLRNTSSGIADAKIFRLPARIFAMPDQAGEGEHLELVLGDQEETVVAKRTLKINRVYG
ncbi:MAG: hypothetical protein LQ349_004031 [Xanthoria aureola]|nr:MAG: hypothetical protein LQ349_004031 [Xanthoria aureola]